MSRSEIRTAGGARARTFAALTAAMFTTLVVFAGPAAAATGTVHTSGPSLNVRSGPHTSSTVVGSVANGATITIDCQTHGDTVTGRYGTSNIWDHIPGKHGYVTDTYVYTGSDGLVAPLCGSGGPSCSTSGLGDPHTCAQAVSWAKAHVTHTYHADYYRRCDHVMALAYGWSASGSTTAYVHWTQVPSSLKHAGSTSVPAGGLAFFSNGGAGHVMISVGGGQFISTDIHGAGTFTYTTISEIHSSWGENYLGWTQPWFKINH
jgi:uncharacterized protein YraI